MVQKTHTHTRPPSDGGTHMLHTQINTLADAVSYCQVTAENQMTHPSACVIPSNQSYAAMVKTSPHELVTHAAAARCLSFLSLFCFRLCLVSFCSSAIVVGLFTFSWGQLSSCLQRVSPANFRCLPSLIKMRLGDRAQEIKTAGKNFMISRAEAQPCNVSSREANVVWALVNRASIIIFFCHKMCAP